MRINKVVYVVSSAEPALLVACVAEPIVQLIDTAGQEFTVELSRIRAATPAEAREYWAARRKNSRRTLQRAICRARSHRN